MAKKLTLTPWFRMNQKPVREGKYEAREKLTGLRMDVYWRTLTDEPVAGWFCHKGYMGPFTLWQAAEKDMIAWRGVLKSGSDK